MSVTKAELEVHGKLLKKKNVVGVGAGRKIIGNIRTNETCWTVMVSKKVEESGLSKKDIVPKEIGMIRTDVVETGTFRALETEEELKRTDRWRPAPGGVSIGHYNITAGTLGMLVRDMSNNRLAILSNNHVLADSNAGEMGDLILQPGSYDGGVLGDKIAKLARFVEIQWEDDDGGSGCPIGKVNMAVFNSLAYILGRKTRLRSVIPQQHFPNKIDAAIAYPDSDDLVENTVLDIGTPSGWLPGNDLEIGWMVRKSGRTTEYTEGQVSNIRASIRVGYGGGRSALFTDQIVVDHVIDPFSQGGDSGSIVFVEGRQVVGLLFAGSSTQTIVNHFENVVVGLNIDLP